MVRRDADRRLGQNFLIDAAAADRIVAAVDPRPGDAVLEIGPGDGALTAPLVAAAGRIAAVEVDGALVRRLRRRFGERALLVYHEDVLRLDPARVLADLGAGADRLLVAGNLPYHISKPLALRLVRLRRFVSRAVLMFQREVAERLTARPGTRAYGPLTVLAGQAFRIEKLFDLPPGAFRPRPKVVSSVTRWMPSSPGLTDDDEAALRACLAVCFARRRRTLRNNLRGAVASAGDVDRLLLAAGLDAEQRAETVTPAGFLRLAAVWRRRTSGDGPDDPAALL